MRIIHFFACICIYWSLIFLDEYTIVCLPILMLLEIWVFPIWSSSEQSCYEQSSTFFLGDLCAYRSGIAKSHNMNVLSIFQIVQLHSKVVITISYFHHRFMRIFVAPHLYLYLMFSNFKKIANLVVIECYLGFLFLLYIFNSSFTIIIHLIYFAAILEVWDDSMQPSLFWPPRKCFSGFSDKYDDCSKFSLIYILLNKFSHFPSSWISSITRY